MKAPKVLVVDDEPSIVEILRHHLESAGYRVLEASNGRQALALIRQVKPQALILDLMLPEYDGLSVCRDVRRQASTAHLPILMLSARGQEMERITGLEMGADDYMVKPFSPREVVARVNAMLRRSRTPHGKAPTAAALTAGPLTLQVAQRTVTVRGQLVHLRPKEFDLLKVFLERPGQVIPREELVEAVWGESFQGRLRTIDVHMKRLREKLGPAKRWLLTVPGVGYKVADLQEVQ